MADEKLRQLSSKVRVLRAEKEWTQEQLAKKAGVSACYIQYLEGNCKKRPRAKNLIKVAKALKIEPSILLEYIEN